MRSRSVKVSELFTIIRGKSKYTRSYGDNHPGQIPLYSASLSGPMTYIDVAEFSGPLLTFATNGYGGSVQILDGDFTINGDRAVLLPISGAELPDLRYLARVLEQELRPLAVGRVGDRGRNEYTKLSPKVALEVSIPLLVDKHGEDDYEAMRDFGLTVERSTTLQNNLRARAEQIQSTNIVLETGESEEVRLGDSDRFELMIGRRVLRDDLTEDGEIPVYSANARLPMGFVDKPRPNDTFDEPSLIWGIDGVFDWNLIPAGQAFVPTDHCGRLLVCDPDLDIEYLLHALRSTRDDHGFDRVYRSSLKNIAEVMVSVPVLPNGSFDPDRQQDLATRYQRLDRIAENLLGKITTLTDVVVTPKV